MRKRARSKNAEAVAAIRAVHQKYDSPLILDDPLAYQLTSPAWRTVIRAPLLRSLVFKRFLRVLRPVHGQILARARFAEDQLKLAVRGGVQQYVILGAGLDSFAFRRPPWAKEVRVYELDHPATQMAKRRRLQELGLPIREKLELLPIDFESQSPQDVLTGSGFNPRERSFFSWLGVLVYLTPEAITDTLSSIASVAAPGSELVLDYMLPDVIVDPSELKTMEFVRRMNERRGEPYLTYYEPSSLAEEMSRIGLEVIEDVSPSAQSARYFTGRTDDLKPWASSCLLLARKGLTA